jgi:hypothetical protein
MRSFHERHGSGRGDFKERARILVCSRVSDDEGGSKVISLDPLPI